MTIAATSSTGPGEFSVVNPLGSNVVNLAPTPAVATSSRAGAPGLTALLDAVLFPARIDALNLCDQNIATYDPHSYLLIFRCRGRNLPDVLPPVLGFFVWGVLWGAIFSASENMRALMLPLDDLIKPLLTPVSLLLVFRLGRAAVRYWDARVAAGQVVGTCRTLSSTALVVCASHPELVDSLARWICLYPLVVKNFLRPPTRQGWQPERRRAHQRLEVGPLLDEAAADELLSANGDAAPVLVLNRLRSLALRAAVELELEPTIRASAYHQINGYIDGLTAAWGVMERINATPLPFVYVVHLRTLLVIYLLAWHLDALATHGWSALPPLVVVSWALLGIEAASVECERPFMWEANHLALGRMGVTVARNVATTLRQTQRFQDAPCRISELQTEAEALGNSDWRMEL